MFSLQKYGGITKYFCEIISNIPPEHEYNLSLIFSDNQYLKEKRKYFGKLNILPHMEFPKKDIAKRVIYAINQYYSTRCITGNNYQLFHPTFYDPYFFKVLKKPYVITVHDLIEFIFKDSFYKHTSIRDQMKEVITKANRIIAISENTKKDIIDVFGIHSEKIDVIYHGYNKPIIQNFANQYGRYILFVGRRDSYKNFKTFIEAISPLFHKEKDLKLVCVGSLFNQEEAEDLKRLNILDRTVISNVNESKLNCLYANALVFVFPSLYEGFGMPILEAFANNCPICLSDTSCFPEIAGDAGVYFDPSNRGSILAAVEKIIYNKDFAMSMRKAGEKRLENFSWKKAAAKTILTYQEAIC